MERKIVRYDFWTLGAVIEALFADYEIKWGEAPLDMDCSHGAEIVIHDNRAQGYGISADIYPFVPWTDGDYKPCHYWGSKYYLGLFKAK